MIAYSKGVGRQLEEFGKLSNVWEVKDYYIVWRIVSIVMGAALVLIGAFLILRTL